MDELFNSIYTKAQNFRNLAASGTSVSDLLMQNDPMGQDILRRAEEYKEQRAKRNEEMGYMLPVSDFEYDAIKMAISSAIEGGANPEDERYRWGTAVMYSRQFGMDLSTVMSSFDSLNKWYLGQDKAPAKTNWQAMADAWNVGKLTYDLAQVTRSWFESGGTNSALEQQADAISAQIESMQDKAPRPWIIEAFKAGLQSAPFTISSMMASAAGSTTATGAALWAAGAAGLVVGTGGIGAIPLAVIAAFGTAGGVAGGLMQSSRDMVGLEYYRMKKAGVREDIAGPLAAVSANIMGLIETSLGNVAGMAGKIGGKASIETLTGAVIKRLSTQNVLGPVARGLMGYGGQVLEEGIEEGLQQLVSNGSDILARELQAEGVGELESRKIGDQVFESVKQGMMASIVMGVPGTMLQTKGNVEEAKALSGMAKQLDKEDFIRKAKESDPAMLQGLPKEQQEAVLTKIWDTQEARAKAAATAQPAMTDDEKVAAVEGSILPGKKMPAQAEKRLASGRLYATEKITLGETSEGFTESIVKVGDPTPGGGKLYSYGKLIEDGDSVTITELKANPGYGGTIRDLVIEIASRKPGKDINWDPKSEEYKKIKQEIIESNPRGAAAGLQWFDVDADAGKMIARQDLKSKIKAWIPKLDDIQRDAAVDLLEARADAVGLSIDQYLDKYHDADIFTASSEVSAAQGKKGGVLFKQMESDIKAIIYTTKNSDFSTWAHENAHIFRRQLDGDMKTEAESVYQVTGGKWTTEQEERFAKDFERYLTDGQAPTEKLKALFQKIAQFMRNIYQKLSGKIDIDPRIRKVFDSLLTKPDSPISQEAQAETQTGSDMPLFQTEAYHGGAQAFDKFTTKAIGTGEGVQYFGWGLYFTSEKEIAEFYANDLTQPELKGAENYDPGVIQTAIMALQSFNTREAALNDAKQMYKKAANPKAKEYWRDVVALLEDKNVTISTNRNVYAVTLNPDKIDTWMDWNDPASPEVVKAFKTLRDNGVLEDYDPFSFPAIAAIFGEHPRDKSYVPTGNDIYMELSSLTGGEKEASLALQKAGVDGIRFPARGDGTDLDGMNYVVFDENAIEIKEHILFQTDEELMAEAKDFDTWEEWRDFNQAMVDPEDMSREQKQNDAAWYKQKWEEAHRPTMTTEDGQTALDPEQLDNRFIESMADEETLNGFLADMGEILNDKFTEEVSDQEEYDAREKASELQRQISAEVTTTIQLNAQAVANGKKLSTTSRKQILTSMKQAPRAYRALYADVTGNQVYAVTDEQLREVLPEIQDPRLPATKRFTITERVRIAKDIKNAEIAQKIRTGDITEAELVEHVDYLKKKNTELNKTITEKEREIEKDELKLSEKERRIAQQREKLEEAERTLKKLDAEVNALKEQKRRISERLTEQRQEAARKVYNLKREYGLKIQGERALAYVEKKKALKDMREEYQDRIREIKALAKTRARKLQLAKYIMRKVSNAIHWEEAGKIRRIQDSIDPNFRKPRKTEMPIIEELREGAQWSPEKLARFNKRLMGLITGRNLTTMTVEQLEGVAAAIDELKDLGRQKRAAWKLDRQNRVMDARRTIDTAIAESGNYVAPPAYGSDEQKKQKRGIKSFMRGADYSFLNMERKAMMMDNGKEGENHKLLVADERTHRRAKLDKIQERMAPVLEAMKTEGLKIQDLFAKHTIKEIGPNNTDATYTISDLMFAVLAHKDADSNAAVAYGNLVSAEEKATLTPEQVAMTGARRMRLLIAEANKILTPKHRAVMETIGADFAKNFDRLDAVAKEEFNRPLTRVDFYVPLKRKEMTYDNLAEAVADDLLNLNGGGLSRTPQKGMTMERIKISPHHQKPVEMDLFSTWRQAVETQEHLINYATYMRDMNAVYKQGRGADTTRALIAGAYGNEMLAQVDDYLNELANPSAFQQRDHLSKTVKALRGDLDAAYLGYKMSSVVTQLVTSPMPYLAYLKNPGRLLANYFKFLGWPPSYKSAWAEISEKSAVMRNRSMDPIMQAIKEGMQDKASKGLAKMKEIGMKGLEWADRVSVMAGWMAVYDEAMIETGGNEQAAIEKADSVTLKIQPTGEAADLAPAFKTKQEAWRVFLQFQAALNVIWQNIRYDLPTAVKNREYGRAVGIVTSYAMAGALLGLVKKGFKGKDDDEDKKAVKLLYWSMTQFTDSVPLVGSLLTGAIERGMTGEKQPPFQSSLYPAVSEMFQGINQMTSGEFGKAAADFGSAMGYFIGAPVSGAKEIIKAAQADGMGDAIGKLAGRRD